jgi:predicted O-linked N-acetylglucosamine transferase (SPINDLY family)
MSKNRVKLARGRTQRQATPVTRGPTLDRALKLHRSGNLEAAKKLYLNALTKDPGNADLLHLLGVLDYEQGAFELAKTHLFQAIEQDDTQAPYFNNLANVYRAEGSFKAAEYYYLIAACLDETYADAFANLGSMYSDLGNAGEAEAILKKALHLNVASADVSITTLLAKIYISQNEFAKAIALYESALALAPNHLETRLALGDARSAQGDHAKAALCFAQMLTYDPVNLVARQRLNEAMIAAARMKEQEDHFAAAEICYLEVLKADPKNLEALHGLARCQSRLRRPVDAIETYGQCLKIDPLDARTYNELGLAHLGAGDAKAAFKAFQKAIALNEHLYAALSNAILALHYIPDFSQEDIKRMSLDYARRMNNDGEALAQALSHQTSRYENSSPNRRLRIGYVSADFHAHPVAHFFTKIVENHDKTDFEIFAYYNGRTNDAMTKRISAACDHWADIAGLDDEKLASLIKTDEIDILIDLSGHTGGNRLPMFALRPAPIQASWLGFWSTTGLHAMDYILMDEISVPPGEEVFYTEQVVRLPYGRFCFDAHSEAPLPAEAPFLKNGFVTFGTFNNLAKINDGVIAVWRDILESVEGSRLLIKYFGLNNASVSDRLSGALSKAGIPAERVELRGHSPHVEMLATYGEIDIALDPFPFGGGMTSCEALWMGVPVVSLVGDRPVSRQTLSFLTMANVRFLAARSEREYIEKAASLAQNPLLLSHLRHVLRNRLANSEMCDGVLFTHSLESALRAMVKRSSFHSKSS